VQACPRILFRCTNLEPVNFDSYFFACPSRQFRGDVKGVQILSSVAVR
jgi:hypothetical protein